RWTKWALSRAKRDVKPAGLLRGLGAAADVLPLIRTQDVKEDSRVSPPSNREDAHIRVKRYRQSINRFPHFQTKACRFGTCTVHWLVDELHRAAVNDRNDAAPPNKISPQGYGRRRRSLPERRSPARSPSSGRRPRTRRAQPLAAVLGV
ncbi:ADML protein, partial [Chloropsis hardwickii]|nr:ADML protein [Chloropsis hardwickii]